MIIIFIMVMTMLKAHDNDDCLTILSKDARGKNVDNLQKDDEDIDHDFMMIIMIKTMAMLRVKMTVALVHFTYQEDLKNNLQAIVYFSQK